MNNINVLVIGETCIDRFIYCEVNRLSPEAPVPVLNPVKITENQGMAGNTEANISVILHESSVSIITQIENITKTRYVESKSNHMFLRVDDGERSITPFKYDNNINKVINESDIVIVSDYNKGFLSDIDLKKISSNSKLSILDSKRKLTDEIIKDFTFIKLNENEFINNTDLNHDGIIVTLGQNGASYKNQHYPSPNPQETIDVSGAGDTFTAAFISAYYVTGNIGLSIMNANKKSADVVSRRGVVTPK